MSQRTKCLPLYLTVEEYARLERVARAEERDPLQQARWLIRKSLELAEQPSTVGVLELNGVLELTSQQVAIITIALSVVNAALRLFATNQPVSVGSSVPSQAGKSR